MRQELSKQRVTAPQVLTMVVGEHQQVQPHQHLSQIIIAATVLPSTVGHKDESPARVRREPVRKATEHRSLFRTHRGLNVSFSQ
jgi:hypothetical protein